MAEEKLERANFYGAEKIIAGHGGAAGGSGGGGMGITGGAYVPAEGGITTTNRWLRFDFDNPSHKALKILAGTTFSMGDNIIPFDETTSIDLSDYISEPGADYYVFVNADKRVVCSTSRTQPDGYMFIGQFHTLCADVGDNVTGIVPVDMGSVYSVGDFITIQNYFKERDLDFYNFYNKRIDSISIDNTYYSTATILHSLSGFKAGDILPESVWCLNWHPASKSWDGMVWCNGVNCCVDIYLQSGDGFSTRSEYGSVHTVNRSWQNHVADLLNIGKRLMELDEFYIISLGSNVKSALATDQSTVGGHSTSTGRRMISFIGCEECCGYLSQWNRIPNMSSQTNVISSTDGLGLLGQTQDLIVTTMCGNPYTVVASLIKTIGPRAIAGSDPNIGGGGNTVGARGCCDVTIV